MWRQHGRAAAFALREGVGKRRVRQAAHSLRLSGGPHPRTCSSRRKLERAFNLKPPSPNCLNQTVRGCGFISNSSENGTHSHPVPSRPISSRLVPSRLVPSRPVPLCPVPSPVLSRPVSSRPVSSRPVPSCPVPPRPVPSCPVPSRRVALRLVPSRPVPSRLVRSGPVPSRFIPLRPSRRVPSRPVPSRPSRPVPSHLAPSRPVPYRLVHERHHGRVEAFPTSESAGKLVQRRGDSSRCAWGFKGIPRGFRGIPLHSTFLCMCLRQGF